MRYFPVSWRIVQYRESYRLASLVRSGSSSTWRIRCLASSASALLLAKARSEGSIGFRISIRMWPWRGSTFPAGMICRDPEITTGTTGTPALIAAAKAPERNRPSPRSLMKVPSGNNASDSPALAALNNSLASRALPDASKRSTNFEPIRRNRILTTGKFRISPLIT